MQVEHKIAMSEPINYIDLTKERYALKGYDEYRWLTNDRPPALVPLKKPLKESRLALVVSSGAYVAGQVAFHYKDDTSLRLISKSIDPRQLRFAHVSNHLLDSAREDPNSLVPLRALLRLEEEGKLGEVFDPIISCMGGVYSQRKVREQLIPAIAAALDSNEVDGALLVPMCPICHQTMSALARHLEENGLPTVCLASAYDIIKSANPPRAVFVDYPLGNTAGRPGDPDDQYGILSSALEAFEAISRPGSIVDLGKRWESDASWKAALRLDVNEDQRGVRDETPRYQFPEDKMLAETVSAGACGR